MISLLKPKLTYFRKQLILVIGINFLSLAVVSSVLYTNFVADYRDNLVSTMTSKVSMLSASSSSALLFDDSGAATDLLASLSESPNTRFAQLFDAQQQSFAAYIRPGATIDVTPAAMNQGSQFLNNTLYLYQTIEMDGETLGHILLSVDTNELKNQQTRYARIVLVIFAFSLLFAYGLNWRLQSVMFAPINKLAELVSYVAQKRKYHRRIDFTQDDEIGSLVKGVNSMLDTIEEHEKQLQENSDRLESLVALRTEQLFQRANYDALTQLPNRHLLIDRLSHGIDNADREKSGMALMFLDLDRFKVINDSLGHSIGDQLLSQVARKLVSLVSKADSVCRWGGDEFVILVEHLEQTDDVENLAIRIINTLSQPMDVSGHLLHISTSIGIARYPYDGSDSMTLLKHADISMYRAKDQGPGKYCFFNSTMLDDSVQRLSMESQIRSAFDNNEFHLVYQPQLCLESNTMCGIEALIRWTSGGKMTPPNEFLPVVEEIGLMNTLSEWVLKESCQQTVDWQEQGFKVVPVAVNLPASFIILPNCAQIVSDILKSTGLAPELLEIEITENTFVASTDMTIKTLEKLKNMQVGIAIDDFGTGYSCMSYLRDLPVSKLKIDGSFVQHIGESEANDGIVKSIITLGKSLKLRVVGECVELANQNTVLKEMGCDIAQGYLHSKPLDRYKMAEYLKNS